MPVSHDSFDYRDGAEITPVGKARRDSNGAPLAKGGAAGGAGTGDSAEGGADDEPPRISEGEILKKILAFHVRHHRTTSPSPHALLPCAARHP